MNSNSLQTKTSLSSIKIQTPLGLARFTVNRYSNDRPAICLIDANNSQPIAVLTVNLPNSNPPRDEFYIKSWAENEEIANLCRNSGYFIDTQKRQPTGFVVAELWKLAEGIEMS